MIQDLLLPIFLDSKPNRATSNKGAQKNFRAYGNPTKANKPIVVLLIPKSASHIPKVEEVKSKGRPEKKPTCKNINNFFSKHFLRSFINILCI